METGLENVCVINFNKRAWKNSCISLQDVVLQLPEPLKTDWNIPVSTVKLIKTIRNTILMYREAVQDISAMAMAKCVL